MSSAINFEIYRYDDATERAITGKGMNERCYSAKKSEVLTGYINEYELNEDFRTWARSTP